MMYGPVTTKSEPQPHCVEQYMNHTQNPARFAGFGRKDVMCEFSVYAVISAVYAVISANLCCVGLADMCCV